MNRESNRRGLGATDAVVALAVIATLVVLLLPALQAAREQSRAAQCSANLQQIGLALQNYHDTYKVFPAGAMHAGTIGSSERIGPAWWYGLLPFLGERQMYDRISATQGAAFPVAAVPFNARAINGISDPAPYRNLLAAYTPAFLRCPASPLPVMEHGSGPIALPTYVGIAGGCDISDTSDDYRLFQGGFPELQAPRSTRRYVNRTKGFALHGGIMTSSGMLLPCEHAGMRTCTDGTSNTMIVGEQSDWLGSTDPSQAAKYHGDPGWDTEGTAGTGPVDGGGFLSGAVASTRVPASQGDGTADGLPGAWRVDCYNVTTVLYRLNAKRGYRVAAASSRLLRGPRAQQPAAIRRTIPAASMWSSQRSRDRPGGQHRVLRSAAAGHSGQNKPPGGPPHGHIALEKRAAPWRIHAARWPFFGDHGRCTRPDAG